MGEDDIDDITEAKDMMGISGDRFENVDITGHPSIIEIVQGFYAMCVLAIPGSIVSRVHKICEKLDVSDINDNSRPDRYWHASALVHQNEVTHVRHCWSSWTSRMQ